MKQFALAALFMVGTAFAQPSSFSVEVSGTGKPVILIPGLGCESEVWDETVAHLNKRGYQTHALTLAGFGGTKFLPSPAREHFLATVREDLAAYIQEKKLDHPVVIGHSLGGFLAIWLAETNPDLPGKVISVDGLPFIAAIMNANISPEEVKTAVDGTRKRFTDASDADFQKLQRESVQGMIVAPANVEREMKVAVTADRAAVAEAMVEMMGTDLRPELGKIKAPLLEMGTWIAYKDYGATHDGGLFLYGKQFVNLPSAKVIMNDTSKHFIQLDAPEWFYNQVDEFLQTK